jgi:3-isopropylmalate/(R)-2-methylmalate dehydratase small subunit
MTTVVYVVGDDISTDVIYPGRYMATVLPSETPQYAFANDAAFNKKLALGGGGAGGIAPGSIVVAGRNFGCGSSREQAVSCLAGHQLTIVARGFARIFLQNAINLGLKIVICPTIEARVGDVLEIGAGGVKNKKTGERYATMPLPASRQAIIDAGGLIAYTRRRLTT